MSYSIDFNNVNSDSILGLGESVTTDCLYKTTHIEPISGAITTQYVRDLKHKVKRAITKAGGAITEPQKEVLSMVIAYILDLEAYCGSILSKYLRIEYSVEDEYCIYRKSTRGVSLIAIDTDGDLMFNFTGYNGEFQTDRYTFQELDLEAVTYSFLSK